MKISNVVFSYYVGITFFALSHGAAAPGFSTPKKNAAKPAPMAAAAALQSTEPDFSNIIPNAMLENLIFQQADLLREDPVIAFLFQKRIEAHSGQIYTIAISPYDDDRFIVTGSDDKTVKIWNLDGSLRWQLPAHAEGAVIKVVVSPFKDDKFILTVTPKGVRRWNLDGKVAPTKKWGVMHRPEISITSFAINSDENNKMMFQGLNNGTVRILDLNDPEGIYTNLRAHDKPVRHLAVRSVKANTVVATADDDMQVKMWTLNAELESSPVKQFKASNLITDAVFFADDTNRLIGATTVDGHLYLWNYVKGTKELAMKLAEGKCTALAIGNLEGPTIVASANKSLKAPAKPGLFSGKAKKKEALNATVYRIALSNQLKGTIDLTIDDSRISATLDAPDGPVGAIAISLYRDNPFVAFGSGHVLWIWDHNMPSLDTVTEPNYGADVENKEEAALRISGRETVPVWLTLDNMLKLKEIVREARANGNVLRPTPEQGIFIDKMPADLRARFKAVFKIEEPKAKRKLFGGWGKSKKGAAEKGEK